MNTNPQEYLIHVTNRGPKTHAQVVGDPGSFKVFMKQPLKDINKFGMMMYSVPKTLDLVQHGNQHFNLVFTFRNRHEVVVPVVIPELDYYDTYVSQASDKSGTNGNNGLEEGKYRSKTRLAFDEVLQTSINWAIMEQFEKRPIDFPGPVRRLSDDVLSRLGCVVKFDQGRGVYKFYFGYKAMRALHDAGAILQRYNGNILVSTGNPCPTHAFGGDTRTPINPSGTGQYDFISPMNHHYTAAHKGGNGGVPNGFDPWSARENETPQQKYDALRLDSVSFQNVSLRLQLMLGLSGSDVMSSEQLNMNDSVTRGRMILANYEADLRSPGDPGPRGLAVGLVEFESSVPPNLDPPSFLYLQVLVPGTRSKILGQSDERGGWALPTPQNAYISKYLNLPAKFGYHKLSARLMPVVTSEANYQTFFANLNLGGHVDGIGFNFDPIPVQAGDANANTNWSLTSANNRSRFIRIGGLDSDGTRNSRKASCCKFPRAMAAENEATVGMALGVGYKRRSPCFTTSLIEPNWIYTSVENATMQTIDVQLMWGDTSETVSTIVGQPVQFSIIASP